MAIDIKAFRAVNGTGSNASIKIDTKKSQKDGVVLKTFGGGKTMIGRALRNSGGSFARFYSFVKDPSGSKNMQIRKQFVAAMKNEFPGMTEKVEKLVKTASREPLSVHLVKQLISEGDRQKTRTDFDCGYGLTINHSSFTSQNQMVSAFETFAGKTGLDENGSRLLRLMDSPHGTLVKEDLTFSALREETQGMRRADALRHKGYASDLARCSGELGSPVVETMAGEERLSFETLLQPIPESAFLRIPDAGGLVDASLECKNFDEFNGFVTDLLKAVAQGDEGGIKAAGQKILDRTEAMIGLLDKVIDGLLDPTVRNNFQSAARLSNDIDGSTAQKSNVGLAQYDTLLSGLRQMRDGLLKPDGAFHGLIALGCVAITRPELVVEKLAPRPQGNEEVRDLQEHRIEPKVLVENDPSDLIQPEEIKLPSEPKPVSYLEIKEKSLDDL